LAFAGASIREHGDSRRLGMGAINSAALHQAERIPADA
jgi:hypothetical protein